MEEITEGVTLHTLLYWLCRWTERRTLTPTAANERHCDEKIERIKQIILSNYQLIPTPDPDNDHHRSNEPES